MQGLNNVLVVEEKLQGGPWSHEQVDRDGMDSKGTYFKGRCFSEVAKLRMGMEENFENYGCCEAALQMEAWSEKVPL